MIEASEMNVLHDLLNDDHMPSFDRRKKDQTNEDEQNSSK